MIILEILKKAIYIHILIKGLVEGMENITDKIDEEDVLLDLSILTQKRQKWNFLVAGQLSYKSF